MVEKSQDDPSTIVVENDDHNKKERETFIVKFDFTAVWNNSVTSATQLLVQGLGVGGGGGNVSVTGSLVRAGGLLQSGSILEVGFTSGVVGLGVAGDEVEREEREHCDVAYLKCPTAACFGSCSAAASAAECCGGYVLPGSLHFHKIMTGDNATLRRIECDP